MLTHKTKLFLVFALHTAVATLLVSCPAGGQTGSAKAQQVVQSTTSTTSPDSALSPPGTPTDSAQETIQVGEQPGEPEPSRDEGVKEPTWEESADEGKTKDVTGEEQNTEASEKPPRSKNYRPPKEEGVQRPSEKPRTKKSFVSVELWFQDAKFNDAEDAKLSNLLFEFRANLGRKQKQVEQVTISNYDDAVGATLDMGLCILEIYPVVQPPKFEGHGSVGRIGLKFDGMYHIKLYKPEGELIGVFGIYSDGTFGAAPLKERPEGYLVKAVRLLDSFAPVPYTVYLKTPAGEKPKNLVTIQFNGGGYQQQQVEDAAGNLYNYRFPSGRLELFDPNEK